MKVRNIFLTFFGLGLSPIAPGTFGTFGGAIFGYLILKYFSIDTLFLLSILITLIAINQINIYEQITKTHDHKSIVIDEVVGVWIAFILSSSTLAQLIFSVIFFRIFDIWKPSIIGRIDKQAKGGIGVMGDDIVAGILAGIASSALYQLLDKFQLL